LPNCVIVIGVLKSDFTPTEKQRITELATWGRSEYIKGRPRNPVVVLTGSELLSEDRITEGWEAAGGKAALLAKQVLTREDDPEVIADLTQQLYLDLPSFGAEHAERVQRAAGRPPAN